MGSNNHYELMYCLSLFNLWVHVFNIVIAFPFLVVIIFIDSVHIVPSLDQEKVLKLSHLDNRETG